MISKTGSTRLLPEPVTPPEPLIRRRKTCLKSVVFILLLSLVAFLRAETTPCVWSDIERIVVVGDIHGDFRNFVRILRGTGLVDMNLHWIGGSAHLVQLGDIMDRGSGSRKVFDLIRDLEIQSKAAGGRVHMLIGNHEELNIIGIVFGFSGYVTADQFISFLPESYVAEKEKEFRVSKGETVFSKSDPSLSLEDPEYLQFWTDLMKDPWSQQKYINTFNDLYGDWILEHNAVIRINDIVFVHGGVSEKYSTWPLEKLNALQRKELKTLREIQRSQVTDPYFRPQLVYRTDSLLWYRDLASRDEALIEPEVEKIMKNLDARAMVIGHTTLRKIASSLDDVSRFGGRVWSIDTGISKSYGGIARALIINSGKFSLWGD